MWRMERMNGGIYRGKSEEIKLGSKGVRAGLACSY